MPANIITAARIGNTAPTGAVGTTIVTLTAGAILGQRVLVMACNNMSNTDPAQTIVDSRGNVYQTVLDGTFGNVARRMAVFGCKVTTALQINDTITITHAAVTPNRRTATAISCANISLLNPIITAVGSGNASTAISSGATAARLDANSIIFGVAGNNQTVTGSSFAAGAGFVSGESLESGTLTTWRTLGTEWQIMSAGGTEAATGTWATAPVSWDMLAVVFQQLDAGDEPAVGGNVLPRSPMT